MTNSTPAVTVKTMSSLEIAETTGKRHSDVMRSIKAMAPAWEKVNGRKIALVEYTDAKGEKRPMYELTQKECLYVSTKFNDEARAKLILRWEELEMQIQQPDQELINQVYALAKHMLAFEGRLNKLEEPKQEARYLPEKENYYTVSIYAKLMGKNLHHDVISFIGTRASLLCNSRDIDIETTPNPVYGSVNMYPQSILEELFKFYKLLPSDY